MSLTGRNGKRAKAPPPREEGGDLPFKGSRKCRGCKCFFTEKKMYAKTYKGRFYEDSPSTVYWCWKCAYEDGVVGTKRSWIQIKEEDDD